MPISVTNVYEPYRKYFPLLVPAGPEAVTNQVSPKITVVKRQEYGLKNGEESLTTTEEEYGTEEGLISSDETSLGLKSGNIYRTKNIIGMTRSEVINPPVGPNNNGSNNNEYYANVLGLQAKLFFEIGSTNFAQFDDSVCLLVNPPTVALNPMGTTGVLLLINVSVAGVPLGRPFRLVSSQDLTGSFTGFTDWKISGQDSGDNLVFVRKDINLFFKAELGNR